MSREFQRLMLVSREPKLSPRIVRKLSLFFNRYGYNEFMGDDYSEVNDWLKWKIEMHHFDSQEEEK